jgi:hypothetical protein
MSRFPKTLGACVDLAYNIRAIRLEEEKKIKKMKADEAALEEHILATFAKQGGQGFKGTIANAAITRTDVPQVDDYQTFAAFVIKTKAIELLERRPSRSACQERWEAGQIIPGITKFTRIGLSLTKIGEK